MIIDDDLRAEVSVLRKRCFELERENKRLLKEAFDERRSAGARLSKLGASKGGKVRAEKLSQSRRKEIAVGAAVARWQKRKSQGFPGAI